MKSKRLWLTLIVLAIAGVALWKLEDQRGRPPQVTFAKATRENISSLVSTNGKVEPVESGVARAERSGAVKNILIQRGQRVEKGQTLVELDASDAQAELKTLLQNAQTIYLLPISLVNLLLITLIAIEGWHF